MFLLDTNVISHATKSKQHPRLKEWFGNQTEIAIPFPVFFEIQSGIDSLMPRNPSKAVELQAWLQRVIDSDFHLPPMTPAVAMKMAELYACRSLKNLWFSGGGKREAKPGQDLTIAAIAIVHELPIASLDVGDFQRINELFRLPGVYNPMSDEWCVPPSEIKVPKFDRYLPRFSSAMNQSSIGPPRDNTSPTRALLDLSSNESRKLPSALTIR